MKFKIPTPRRSPVAAEVTRRTGQAPPPHVGGYLAAFLLLVVTAANAADPPVVAAVAPKAIPVVRPTRSDTVDFHREILPFLQATCLPCHNKTSAKADLLLETPADMIKGGESGPALVPGKAGESLLLRVSAHEMKPRMPPAENKVNAKNLTPEQLGLLALWIDQGAQAGTASSATIAWQKIPTNFSPVISVAITPDGRFAACGRANQIHLYDLPSRALIARLEDPALASGVAQRDVVNALAMSPDGALLAAGGYREVRLWQRREPTPEPFGPPVEPLALAASPDGRLVAASQPDRDVLIFDAATGAVLRRLDAPSPAPELLAFAPDGAHLAGASSNGVLRVWGLAAGTRDRQHAVTNRIRALAWMASSRDVAIAVEASPSNSVNVLAIPAGTDEAGLVQSASAPQFESPVTALADAAALDGAWLAICADGSVRLSSTNADAGTRILVPPSPPTPDATMSAPARVLAVASRGTPTRLWQADRLTNNPVELAADPRRAAAVARATQALAFHRSEQEFHKAALQRGEEDWRKATNAVAQATTRSQTAATALTDKEQNLAKEQENRAAADKDKSELAAQIKQVTDRAESSRKAADEAHAAARKAAELQASSRLAAAQATQTRTDLERVVANLGGTADEPTAARAREATETAARDADARKVAATEAETGAGKAIDDLAARASEAGEARALAARADAELKPRLKQAGERFAAAEKSVAELTKALDRARIDRDTTEADRALARRNETTAQRAVDETRAALASEEHALVLADTTLRDATLARDAAIRRGHTWIATDPTGTRLVTVDDSTATFWTLPEGRPLFTLDLPPLARPVAVVADGSLIVSRSGGLARLSVLPRWEFAGTLGTGDERSAIVDRVTALAFSPDGRLLASGGGEPSRSGELKLWSVADRALARDLGAAHSDCVLALVFSPSGEWIASGGADRFLRVSEVATGRRLRNFEGHTHHVLGAAWTADGRTLASAGAEGVVKTWNRVTGDRVKNVEGFGKEVTAVHALGIAAEFLAVAGSGQARVFKPDGSQVRTLPAGSAFLQALAVTPDGSIAVAGGDDGILRAWTVPDGAQILELAAGPALAGH